jgi:hypothetical protein
VFMKSIQGIYSIVIWLIWIGRIIGAIKEKGGRVVSYSDELKKEDWVHSKVSDDLLREGLKQCRGSGKKSKLSKP